MIIFNHNYVDARVLIIPLVPFSISKHTAPVWKIHRRVGSSAVKRKKCNLLYFKKPRLLYKRSDRNWRRRRRSEFSISGSVVVVVERCTARWVHLRARKSMTTKAISRSRIKSRPVMYYSLPTVQLLLFFLYFSLSRSFIQRPAIFLIFPHATNVNTPLVFTPSDL